MKESIYQLYVIPYDDAPIYIGRTSRPLATRLREHLQESKTGKSIKCETIKQLVADSFEIGIALLETVDLNDCYGDEEDVHINNAEGRGFTLLNATGGSTERYEYVATGEGWVPWHVDDFKSLSWDKNYIASRSGERGTHLKGISFYRKGSSHLRMIHPVDGERICAGFVWESKITLVCDYMNELHNIMLRKRDQK